MAIYFFIEAGQGHVVLRGERLRDLDRRRHRRDGVCVCSRDERETAGELGGRFVPVPSSGCGPEPGHRGWRDGGERGGGQESEERADAKQKGIEMEVRGVGERERHGVSYDQGRKG